MNRDLSQYVKAVLRPTTWNTWFWAVEVGIGGTMMVVAFGDDHDYSSAMSAATDKTRKFLASEFGVKKEPVA